MHAPWLRPLVLGVTVASLALASCSDGDDGAPGPPGPPGGSTIDATTLSNEALAGLDVVSEVTSVEIASPPVVEFTLKTAAGVPITGVVAFWEDDNRYVRFTLTKLVPGTDGDPDSWVSYTRDEESGEPDYDSGASLMETGDGVYEFTFATDVTELANIPYEPDLTHRLAGQLGSGSIALEAQNYVHDFVPSGAALTRERKIAVMTSCNECHSDLVFHGRRFRVEYCVNCHNPDLAQGEGNFSYMIHHIHSAQKFDVLDDGVDFSEVTYPQDLRNCRKCHNPEDEATPQASNFLNLPNLAACFGCHAPEGHPGGTPPETNTGCAECHPAAEIEQYHITPNPTPNNPMLLAGQRKIDYDLMEASVGEGGEIAIEFRILSDGEAIDITNLPDDLAEPGRFPAFLLAWAEPQDGVDEPADYNNRGQRGAQPPTVDLGDFVVPVAGEIPPGTIDYDAGSGVHTATITDETLFFPEEATMRAVGLQGYFEQLIGEEEVSLHTPSAVVAVTGDDARRLIIDNDKCAKCHEWFEGHGGNRTYNIAICALCHVPNMSSSGRTVTDPTARDLDDDLAAAILAGTLDESVDPTDPLTYPEDAQSLMNLVHGIHSADDRSRPFQHVRGPNRQGYYDWEEITFPRGASTSNCLLCHAEGTYELPLPANLLPTTVRTTLAEDGMDGDAEDAFLNVPNETDWINSPTAAACFMCHTEPAAMAHMAQNGALLSDPSVPADGPWANRDQVGTTFESCTICHGPGKLADIEEVHGL